jgi:hypothetical protein
MQTFKDGEMANIRRDGKEVDVTVLHQSGTQVYLTDGESRQYTVQVADVLPAKGPYFAVRGLILTASPRHPDEVGEIIATAYTPETSTRVYYKVMFSDGSTEWLSDDQIFIENKQG